MARRVNTRFIGIFAACAIGVVGVVYIAQKTLVHGSASQFRLAAQDAERNNNWPSAVANWAKAVTASPNDPDLWTSYGVALHNLGLEDPDFAAKQQDRDAWQHALEISPQYPSNVPQEYLPAVADLVDFWRDQLAKQPSPEAYRGATDRATQFLDILSKASDDSTHPEFEKRRKDVPDVEAFLYDTIVDEWVTGLITDDPAGLAVSAAAATQPSLYNSQPPLADTERKMRDLLATELKGITVDADLPYHLALIDIHRGQLAAQESQSDKQPLLVTGWYQKAQAEMTDVLKTQGSNPTMRYSYAEVENSLAGIDHFTDENNTTQDTRNKHRDTASAQMDLALNLMKGTEPLFVPISLQAAQMAGANGDSDKAQSILAKLLDKQGSTPMVVVEIAQTLTGFPKLRPQAIDTLEKDINAAEAVSAVTPRRYQELVALSDLQIAELQGTTDDAIKGRLRADINRHLKLLADANMDPFHLVQVKALFLLTDHDYIGAVQALTTAMAGNVTLANNGSLIYMLAKAYHLAGERAQAEVYFKKFIAANPTILPARKMLVDELFNDGTEEARNEIADQLDYLLRAAPNDPDVTRLQMLNLNPNTDHDRLVALYPTLPEKTAQDLRAKANVAGRLMRNYDEAARLLTLAMAQAPDPGDIPIATLLAQVFKQNNLDSKALDIVQKALLAHPNDPNLLLTMKWVQGSTEAELKDYQQKLLNADVDVVSRDLTLAQNSLALHATDDAEAHLKNAEKAEPNNKAIWNDLFKVYLATKQYEKMAPYLQKLKDANADQLNGASFEFEVAKSQYEDAQEQEAVARKNQDFPAQQAAIVGEKAQLQRQMDIGSQLVASFPEFAVSYFCMGQAYQANGQLQQAVENYDTAIQKKGAGSEAALMLKDEIGCYYQLNQPDKAMVAIDEGRREFPSDADFLFLHSDYEVKHGEAEAAAKDLDELRINNPKVGEIYLRLAAAEMQIADDKIRIPDRDGAGTAATNALNVMLKAVSEFPDTPEMYAKLAEIYRYVNLMPDAEKTINELDARPLWSARPDAPKMLAQLYAEANEPEKAEAAYAEAVKRARNDPQLNRRDPNLPVDRKKYNEALKTLIDVVLGDANLLVDHKKYSEAINLLTPYAAMSMQIRLQRMNVLIDAGKTADAEAEIKAVLDQNPSNAAQVANLQAVWAKLELESHNLSNSADHLAKALAADPNSVTALAVSAKLRLAQSPPDLDGAIKDLTAARQINPDDTEILEALADVYLDKFDAGQASDILLTALRGQPDNMSLRLRLAYIYSEKAPVRLDQAMQVLQDGLAQQGGRTNPDLACAIVATYQKMGKLDQALQNCEVSVNVIPGNLELIQTYLQLLVDVGHTNEAIQTANVMLQQNDKLWWAWSLRGQAKGATGDKSGAAGDLNQALTIADAQNNTAAAQEIVDAIAKAVSRDAAISIVRQRQAGDPLWTVNLIMLYHQNGQDDLAIAALEPLLAGESQLPPAQRLPRLELAGMIYGTAQPTPRADKAYAIYTEMLSINKDDVPALNNLASLCADEFTPPRVEEGLKNVRHAMDLVTARGASDPTIEDTYGWLLILGGQTDQGMSVLQKAVAQKAFPEGYYHLGEGYLRMNRPQDALQEVNLALKAITDTEQANQPLAPLMRVRVQDLSNRVLSALGQR